MMQVGETTPYAPAGETPVPAEVRSAGVPQYVKMEPKAHARISRIEKSSILEILQRITGEDREAVVISARDSRLASVTRRSFKEFLRQAPLAGIELERAKDFDRELDVP